MTSEDRAYIDVRDISFAYDEGTGLYRDWALHDISFAVQRGEHVAVLGRNGSGKSTLARVVAGLELPASGSVLIDGLDTADDDDAWAIRQQIGLVFQSPDNQVVATTVEEDVAFAPENLGVPAGELRRRVDESLAYVGLTDYALSAPADLSGGQKQKLAIAGIIAMNPACMILDEATSMLDPSGRQTIMELVERLRADGVTILNITHNMSEAMAADRVIVMHQGKVALSGTPEVIFSQVDTLRSLGLEVPVHFAITWDVMRRLGIEPPDVLPAGETACRDLLLSLTRTRDTAPPDTGRQEETEPVQPDVIEVSGLSWAYHAERQQAVHALHNVSVTVRRGELFGIMGHTGSGKSTLIQHLNGLLRIQEGRIVVLGRDVSKVKEIRELRRHVQLLFQYPEHQLFAETVAKDIAFGPEKLGISEDEIPQRIAEACEVVGIPESWMDRSPFELSGGEQRRVALAGVLVMQPEILILDEPAAGLDPAGRDEILTYLRELRGRQVTIILVSHSMDDLAAVSDRILLLNQGHVAMLGTPEEVFEDREKLRSVGLMQPDATRFIRLFKEAIPGLDTRCYTVEAAAGELAGRLVAGKDG